MTRDVGSKPAEQSTAQLAFLSPFADIRCNVSLWAADSCASLQPAFPLFQARLVEGPTTNEGSPNPGRNANKSIRFAEQSFPVPVTQVLVHVSTYQGNPFWYRFFEAMATCVQLESPEFPGVSSPRLARPRGAAAELPRLPGAPGRARGAAAGALRVAERLQRRGGRRGGDEGVRGRGR